MKTYVAQAERLRLMLTNLGPAFVKIGQVTYWNIPMCQHHAIEITQIAGASFSLPCCILLAAGYQDYKLLAWIHSVAMIDACLQSQCAHFSFKNTQAVPTDYACKCMHFMQAFTHSVQATNWNPRTEACDDSCNPHEHCQHMSDPVNAACNNAMKPWFTQVTCVSITLSYMAISAGSVFPPRCDPSRLPEGAREAAGPDSRL